MKKFDSEQYLFFSGLEESKIDFSSFDFDNDLVPIQFLDTKNTTHNIIWEKQTIEKLKEVMRDSGKNKMFAGHDYDSFSGGPGTRDPGDWVATIEMDSLQIVHQDEHAALVGKIKVLGGTEKRDALRGSIRQDPRGVKFSVDVTVPKKSVKYERIGEQVFAKFTDVKGYNSTDWVTYGASKEAGLLFQRFSEDSPLIKEIKEVNEMKFAEYQKLHPEEAKAFEDSLKAQFAETSNTLQAEIEKTKGEIETLKTQLAEAKKTPTPQVDGDTVRKLESRIDQLEKDNKDKDLQLAVIREARSEEKATTIMDARLSASTVPEGDIQTLIRDKFAHTKYLKEDKTLDEAKFSADFDAEVKKVEASLAKERENTVKGITFSDTTPQSEVDKDVAYGTNLFKARFGEKKKAQ